MHALKSLTCFDEVDIGQWPNLIKGKDLNWKKVKNRINKEFIVFHKSLVRNKGDQ
jgi:hypothetical protein